MPGGAGIRSPGLPRGRLLLVLIGCCVNAFCGALTCWQPRMRPPPGHPHHRALRSVRGGGANSPRAGQALVGLRTARPPLGAPSEAALASNPAPCCSASGAHQQARHFATHRGRWLESGAGPIRGCQHASVLQKAFTQQRKSTKSSRPRAWAGERAGRRHLARGAGLHEPGRGPENESEADTWREVQAFINSGVKKRATTRRLHKNRHQPARAVARPVPAAS